MAAENTMATNDLRTPNVVIQKVEKIDTEALRRLIDHEGIDQSEARVLRKLKKQLVNCNENLVTYDLSATAKPFGLGRLIPRSNCVNMTSLNRNFRNLLSAKFYHDLDMANAHFALLGGVCKEYGWACPMVERYVGDREGILAEVAGMCKITRDQAKEKLRMLAYLGPVPMLSGDSDYTYLTDLREECQALAHKIAAQYPDCRKMAKLKRGIHQSPEVRQSLASELASCMSFCLCTEERKCLLAMTECLESKGRLVGSLIYDGCTVEKLNEAEVLDIEIIAQCEQAITEKTKHIVRLVVKPMVSNIELSDEDDGYVHNVPANFKLKDLIQTSSDTRYAYGLIKRMFEERHFKIRQPISFAEIKEDGNLELRAWQSFAKVYENLRFWILLPSVGWRSVMFVEKWVQDGYIRTYEQADFVPPPLVCPDNVYNMWNGFAVDKMTAISTGNIEPWRYHIRVLCGYDEAMAEYFENWWAALFQAPGKLNGIMIVIMSDEGAGKNIILDEGMERMIGNIWTYQTSDPINRVFGKHSNGRCNKLLITMDEVKRKDIMSLWEQMKTATTSKTFDYEQKGIATATYTNMNHFLLFSNNDSIVPPGRRVCATTASPKHCGDKEYFDNLAAYLKDDGNLKAVYEYLLSKDIANINWINDRPQTETYSALQEVNAAKEDLFLAWLFKKEMHVRTAGEWSYPGHELGKKFGHYLENVRKLKDINAYEWRTRFLNQLKLRIIPKCKGAISFVRTKTARKYVLDERLLFQYLVKQHVIEEDYYEFEQQRFGATYMFED